MSDMICIIAMAKLLLALLLLLVDWASINMLFKGIIGAFEGIISAFDGIGIVFLSIVEYSRITALLL